MKVGARVYALAATFFYCAGMVGPYVMQCEYDESSLIFEDPTFTEAYYASLDRIYLGWTGFTSQRQQVVRAYL